MKLSAQALSEGFPSLISMGQMLRTGVCSAVELTEHALRKVRELDGRLHAFVEVYEEEALASALAADRLIAAGHDLGPLHGVPVALKDNVDVRGKVSHAGSTLLSENVAGSDAAITRQLLRCGAVILGKTHMVEFALGAWGANEFMGAPRNPWGKDQHLSPGGSSSGSAVAVAAGMVPLAIGTDTGASVRVPAALCGITGLKPTIGRLSTQGVVPLSTTLDSVGVLAMTAEDASLMFAALTGDEASFPGAERKDGLTPGLSGVRVGVISDEELDGAQPEIVAAYRRAIALFKDQGAVVRQLTLSARLDDLAEVQSTIMLSEAAASWGKLAAGTSRPLDASVRPRILAGDKFTGAQYVSALRRRDQLKLAFSEAYGDLDVFITPSTPSTARPLAAVDHGKPPVRYARIVNLLELCGISVQLGEDDLGLPIGLQIAGAHNADAVVLRVARGFQANSTWHHRRWIG